MHWATAAGRPRCQLCRTDNGHGCSAQWVKLKAVLVALANIPLDELCYNFTDSWAAANDLAVGSAT